MKDFLGEAMTTGTLAELPSRHWIGGTWQAAQGGALMETLDAGTCRPFAEVARGDAGDVDAAVDAARHALAQFL